VVLAGADVFIGCAEGQGLKGEAVATMARNAIVLALALPEPEIRPEIAKRFGAAIAATGRADLPIWLGAEGPRNVAMTAEIADGWLPIYFSPGSADMYRSWLAEGFARPGAGDGQQPDQRFVTRRAQRRLNAKIEAPMRAPPPQS